jgi:hypothetical protein
MCGAIWPDEAWAIIKTMPKVKKGIFPYNGRSVSPASTRACPMLGVENLLFHDLRHEGVSRLFEMDWEYLGCRMYLAIETGTRSVGWSVTWRLAFYRSTTTRQSAQCNKAVCDRSQGLAVQRQAQSRDGKCPGLKLPRSTAKSLIRGCATYWSDCRMRSR